jgi:protein-L-isoaspartate(D-aspartate) O-methyltransferase
MFNFSKARDHMVESQIRTNDVTEPAILKAFRTTSRERFVPKAQMALAYGDAHIEMDEGRVMMRPRDFAKLVDSADIRPSDVVLDIACGRGYSTAIMSKLADTVVGLETSETAVEKATALLVDEDISNAAVVQGDLKAGASEHGPFNVIFINGSVSEVPKTWLSQLADGGRLACIIQDGPVGKATIFTKSGNVVGERVDFDASVPLLPGFAIELSFVF